MAVNRMKGDRGMEQALLPEALNLELGFLKGVCQGYLSHRVVFELRTLKPTPATVTSPKALNLLTQFPFHVHCVLHLILRLGGSIPILSRGQNYRYCTVVRRVVQ